MVLPRRPQPRQYAIVRGTREMVRQLTGRPENNIYPERRTFEKHAFSKNTRAQKHSTHRSYRLSTWASHHPRQCERSCSRAISRQELAEQFFSRRSNTDRQHQVAVEDRPYPKIQKPTDAVLKVSSTALCGSDLHFYRGHLKCPPDFICGHEFVGEIVEKGDEVSKFNIGDKVRNTGEDWE
jgi:hypothetical protein